MKATQIISVVSDLNLIYEESGGPESVYPWEFSSDGGSYGVFFMGHKIWDDDYLDGESSLMGSAPAVAHEALKKILVDKIQPIIKPFQK